tara:strand:+ start:1992 stop:2792 length:801 start_codon:yes stop_codon:yes gene_type:complete
MIDSHLLPSGQTIWVAKPNTINKGAIPAVMWLHERYGIVQHPKEMAVKLANAGYVGVCPDLFHRFKGDKQALSEGSARVIIRDNEALEDIDEVIEFLSSTNYVDPRRIGIIGVCQTGRQPMLYAANRPDTRAVVALYGGPEEIEWSPTEEHPVSIHEFIRKLNCSVLGLFGEADHIISVDAIRKMRDTLEAHYKSYRFRIYKDAPHGWFNDTMPGRYRPEPTEYAWKEILDYLEDAFSTEPSERVIWDFESDISSGYNFANNVRLE